MSEIKDYQESAEAIFKAHANLEEIFVTSDGQGFTEKERAVNHSAILREKEVKFYHRNSLQTKKVKDVEPSEKETLELRYEELYGSKPAHNIGIEKLKERIAEKEAELTKEETEN